MFFGNSRRIAEVIEKCHRELEVTYTAQLTMADVMDWHSRRAKDVESSVLRYAEPQEVTDGEYILLWQSALHEENKVVRSRVIYALDLEPSLKEALDEGKGAFVTFNN